MKKLLDREPTPEMVAAAWAYFDAKGPYNWEMQELLKAALDAAPALPEPGEVEKELRRLDEYGRWHYWTDNHRVTVRKAADLIAALTERNAELDKANVGLADEVRQLTDKDDPLAQNYWRKRAVNLEQMLADSAAETDNQSSRAEKAEAECKHVGIMFSEERKRAIRAEAERNDVFEGQKRLAAQTVRIRRAALGINMEANDPLPDTDTEEIVFALKAENGRLREALRILRRVHRTRTHTP